MIRHGLVLSFALATGMAASAAEDFAAGLAAVQREWAVANYQATGSAREQAFAALVEHASKLSGAFPERVEAVAWEGIVLSTYAGEVGAMSAMKYAKAARVALERAEKLDAGALDGGVYASLGALYSKVPGGFIGFGDDERAEQYFVKALAIDADNIDNNFFYGEFLLDQGRHAEAKRVLEHALAAPAISDRPVFDTGRRNDIRKLLAVAERKASS